MVWWRGPCVGGDGRERVKIATIGGGSSHTPELARGLLDRFERIGLREWWLVDADAQRLESMGGRVRRMVADRGEPFRVRCSPSPGEEALEGARVVIAQMRVGGMDARREDERLCRRWRLIDHEATGVSGLSGALRAVPVLLELAGRMRRLCPDAWLINVASPTGLLVEALQREAPWLRSLGISEGAVRARAMFAEALGVGRAEDVRLDALGLNHLTWIRGARVGSRDVWRQVISEDGPAGSGPAMVRLGLIWDYYLQRAIGERREGRAAGPGGEGPVPPEGLPARSGVGPSRVEAPSGCGPARERAEESAGELAGEVAGVIETLVSGRRREHVVNTRHLGAAEGMPPEWVLELSCRLSRDRVEPLPAGLLPVYARGLLELVKSFELLSVEAALSGSRGSALAALLAHPLGPDVDRAGEVLEDLLETHRDLLPAFFAHGPDGNG